MTPTLSTFANVYPIDRASKGEVTIKNEGPWQRFEILTFDPGYFPRWRKNLMIPVRGSRSWFGKSKICLH